MGHDMTKNVTFLTVLALAMSSASAAPLDLEAAAFEAVALCQPLGATSLENCGTEMLGNTPGHSAARKAIIRLIDGRTAFVRACRNGDRCAEEADWRVSKGISRALGALEGPSDLLLPRSDMRR